MGTLVKIVSKFSGKALDVPLELYNKDRQQWDWGQVQQWDQNGQPQQQWGLLPNDEGDGSFFIVSNICGYYLDVRGGSTNDGAEVWVYSQNKLPNQRWMLEDQGNGFYIIRNQNSRKVLDVTGWNANNGTKLDQWESTNADNQLWQIVHLGPE